MPVAEHANKVWPGSKWPSGEAAILAKLGERFCRWPSFTIQQGAWFGRRGISLGVSSDGDPTETWLSIWVWAGPKHVATRDAILALADRTGLSEPWEPDRSCWELLGAYSKLMQFEDHKKAADWLVGRLDELERIGMFDLVATGASADSELVPGTDAEAEDTEGA